MGMPSQRSYDAVHAANIEKYVSNLRSIYFSIIKKTAKLSKGVTLNKNGEFYFRSHPALNKKMNILLDSLYKQVYGGIVEGVFLEWEVAVEKNNAISNYVYGENITKIPAKIRRQVLSTNEGARRAFLALKENGYTLSDRVWKLTRQFKQEMELALEVGIGDGHSSVRIAKDMQKYLNEPDSLFRRVHDKKTGELRLSKAAKSHNPGRGVYRSSFKNALRMTRNTTNNAYEESQRVKREQQTFVVAIDIHVSPNHIPALDKGGIKCIELQGRYPKNFNWVYKWHVNCICYSTSVIKRREELDEDLLKILDGKEPDTKSKNEVLTPPKNFNDYIKKNAKLWQNWKSKPRFLQNVN